MSKATIKCTVGPKAGAQFGFRVSAGEKIMVRDRPVAVPESIARGYIEQGFLNEAGVSKPAAKGPVSEPVGSD